MAVIVLARLHALAGSEGRLRAALAAAAVRGRDEAGVQQFAAHAALDQASAFMLYEQFADDTALDAHRSQPSAQQARTSVEALVDPAAGGHTAWQPLDSIHNESGPAGHTTLVLFRMRAEHVDAMRAEIRQDVCQAPGMVRFDLNRAADDPSAFMICARWTDRQAWQDHQSDPDYVAFRARTHHMYDGAPDRTLWQPLG